MANNKMTVLVVDDDVRILRLIKRILELENFQVVTAEDGAAALSMFETLNPDLILLDIMMPGMDGYEVCQRIRDFSNIPVIMVTARADDSEVVEGLDTGADDYVTKPFSAKELTARVRAVLRRSQSQEHPGLPAYRYENMVIDFSSRRVIVSGEDIKLTATEYKLLAYLALNAGRIITPDQLLNKVWGHEYVGTPHLLQVNMARLRKKIGDDAKNPRYIITRSGIGYVMPEMDGTV